MKTPDNGVIAPIGGVSIAGHLPQLDGLRAIAIGLVLVHHCFAFWWFGDVLGCLGVRLFFVLSGFLITGILLDSRKKADKRGIGYESILKSFWARRFLRIFPIYYLTIFILALIGVPAVRDIFFWLITYTSNFYMAVSRDWALPVNHFWSLAVEEQFYLVWPLVILLTPWRWLGRVMIGVALIAPIFRVSLAAFGVNEFWGYFATPGCFDSLALGAFVAYWQRQQIRMGKHLRFPYPWAFAIVPVVFFVVVDRFFLGTPVTSLLETFVTLFFVMIVYKAAVGYKNFAGRWLSSSFLQHIGKLSYGLYLYHEIIRHAWIYVLGENSLLGPPTGALYRAAIPVLVLAPAYVIARLSWRFIEDPINNYKKHFPYLPAANSPRRESEAPSFALEKLEIRRN